MKLTRTATESLMRGTLYRGEYRGFPVAFQKDYIGDWHLWVTLPDDSGEGFTVEHSRGYRTRRDAIADVIQAIDHHITHSSPHPDVHTAG